MLCCCGLIDGRIDGTRARSAISGMSIRSLVGQLKIWYSFTAGKGKNLMQFVVLLMLG